MSLKDRLRHSELTIGSWLNLGNVAAAEIMADAGFDWLVVDLEHSTTTTAQAEEMIRVIDLAGCAPFVRIGSIDPVEIKRVMDAGAHGIIVPSVNTREQAEQAVRSVYYPPKGNRGVGLGRAQGYGARFDDYVDWLADNAVVIVQIEHVDAISDLDAILAVEGVDGSMIGPYDLSGSVGKLGQLEDPEVLRQVARYNEAATRVGKARGYHVVTPDYRQVQEKANDGFSFIAFGVDFMFLGESSRAQMRLLAETRGESRP